MLRLSLILILAFSFVAEASDFKQKVFLKTAQKSPIVVVAKVVEIKRSWGWWSGTAPSIQFIRYEVHSVLQGDIEKGEIYVGHYVVHNSLTADDEIPQLSPKLFKISNELILLLKPETFPVSKKSSDFQLIEYPESGFATYISPSENYGAVLAEPKLVRKITKLLKNKTQGK